MVLLFSDPAPAQWSDWSWWTNCDKSCEGGRQKRYRVYNNPSPAPEAKTCDGEAVQINNRNGHRCPGKRRINSLRYSIRAHSF